MRLPTSNRLPQYDLNLIPLVADLLALRHVRRWVPQVERFDGDGVGIAVAVVHGEVPWRFPSVAEEVSQILTLDALRVDLPRERGANLGAVEQHLPRPGRGRLHVVVNDDWRIQAVRGRERDREVDRVSDQVSQEYLRLRCADSGVGQGVIGGQSRSVGGRVLINESIDLDRAVGGQSRVAYLEAAEALLHTWSLKIEARGDDPARRLVLGRLDRHDGVGDLVLVVEGVTRRP